VNVTGIDSATRICAVKREAGGKPRGGSRSTDPIALTVAAPASGRGVVAAAPGERGEGRLPWRKTHPGRASVSCVESWPGFLLRRGSAEYDGELLRSIPADSLSPSRWRSGASCARLASRRSAGEFGGVPEPRSRRTSASSPISARPERPQEIAARPARTWFTLAALAAIVVPPRTRRFGGAPPGTPSTFRRSR
jgi:hypothetical protein